VAREPEFTPPVIYSVDRRQKLMYRIEARPDGSNTVLQPGLIVDARIVAPP
jgi:HlyD family secretion protein